MLIKKNNNLLLQITFQCLLVLVLIVSFKASAAVYQWQDSQGQKHYSDQVRQGAELIRLKPGYSYYTVKKVYDGDTVLLTDGRKVRFLSVNTPEVEGRNKLEEAGGETAKRWLTEKLTGKKVRLEFDQERKDKYGRTLAYIFTEENEHINLTLVRLGLAAINIYPPNLRYLDDFILAQQQAEDSRQGLWRLPAYQVKPVALLTQENYKGWQRLQGRVQSIKKSRKYVFLTFSGSFSVRIAKTQLKFFSDISAYQGKTLEVRGWVNKNKDRFSLLLRHPSAIKIIG